MTYISSQHYLDPETIEEKKAQLISNGTKSVEITFWNAGIIDDGYEAEEYAVQSDGHHTLAAARELGLEIVFVVKDDPEGLTGNDLLEARYLDGDYYKVESSDPMNDEFDLVW